MTDEESLGRENSRPSKRLGYHLPINKGPAGELGDKVRRLPQITSNATIKAMKIGSSVLEGFLGNIKPTPTPGRNERFRQALLETVHDHPVASEIARLTKADVRVEVNEAFGKPVLITVDLLLPDPHRRLTELRKLYQEKLATKPNRGREKWHPSEDVGAPGDDHGYDPHRDLDPKLHIDHREQQALGVLLGDLLMRLVEVCWDNPELAPVAVRGRVLAVHGSPRHHKHLPHVHHSPRGHRPVTGAETLVLDMRDLGFVDEIARVNDLHELYGPPKSDPLWHP